MKPFVWLGRGPLALLGVLMAANVVVSLYLAATHRLAIGPPEASTLMLDAWGISWIAAMGWSRRAVAGPPALDQLVHWLPTLIGVLLLALRVRRDPLRPALAFARSRMLGAGWTMCGGAPLHLVGAGLPGLPVVGFGEPQGRSHGGAERARTAWSVTPDLHRAYPLPPSPAGRQLDEHGRQSAGRPADGVRILAQGPVGGAVPQSGTRVGRLRGISAAYADADPVLARAMLSARFAVRPADGPQGLRAGSETRFASSATSIGDPPVRPPKPAIAWVKRLTGDAAAGGSPMIIWA